VDGAAAVNDATDKRRHQKRRSRRKGATAAARCPRQPWTPVSSNSPFIDETLAYWQPRSRRALTREDARQIIENVSGFFSILLEWDAAERQTNGQAAPQAAMLRERDKPSA
jgi:hypothetical protein